MRWLGQRRIQTRPPGQSGIKRGVISFIAGGFKRNLHNMLGSLGFVLGTTILFYGAGYGFLGEKIPGPELAAQGGFFMGLGIVVIGWSVWLLFRWPPVE